MEIGDVAEPNSVKLVPLHTGLESVEALTDVGVVFTVTIAVVAVSVLHMFDAVTVYIPALAVDTVNGVGF